MAYAISSLSAVTAEAITMLASTTVLYKVTMLAAVATSVNNLAFRKSVGTGIHRF
ncbi:MAG: hypothetical protein KIG68_02465 [Oxalobacter sp.]|nr:hypothetical protein [Oxalobacter sp.]